MLQVLCVQTELQEYGEVIAVGDHVKRLAGRLRGGYYGTHLDEVAWGFDRYAELTSGETVVIEGDVAAVAGVFVRLASIGEHGWTAEPGSAWLEPVSSTAETRAPEDRAERSPEAPPRGRSLRVSHRRPEEGDEHLSGWLFRLDNEVLTPAPLPQPSQGPKTGSP